MDGRFIISTGRSGSTLLSRMLTENKHVLVLSEFIAAVDNASRFREGNITGDEFAEILMADDGLSALIAARGRASPEALYEGLGNDGTATGRMPAIMRASYPILTDQPEALFAETIDFVRAQPAGEVGAHYRVLFDWLCDKFDKQVWVERSGFGIRLFPGIRKTFPDARYFHIHRDGVEAALSMYDHPYFRVGVYFDFYPPTEEEAKAAILHKHGSECDAVSRHYKTPPPVELYGQHWTNILARAFRDITLLNREQYLAMRFEDMVGQTKLALETLAHFFELPDDPGWIGRAAQLVKGDLQPRANRLSAEETTRLELACMPGQILLGRADPSRLDDALAVLQNAFLSLKE